uniref:Anaphase-promoting complex subunit 1 middle domain-containing protein n=1 Tax=Clytia hemisphaerica TaxID=252671 RepID=A0A7M5WZL4_9CNID
MPTLFSLAHPMEDFKPVVYHNLDNRKPMYFTDATQHIVFTSPKDSLIMTYDSVLGLHSVWKARKALEQDFPEVLSHQDSLPEFGMMNQSSQLGALKGGPGITGRFSMSPSVTTSNKRHSCPPIPIHLQQKGSPGASSSPMSRKGFSPAGHLHKGSPHHHLHANSHHHEAHESSYVSEINGSKRSHMNSLIMFRMSCADTRLEEEAEPLPPNLCLEQVWQEQTTTIRYGLKGKSVFCFMSTDFNGISYLGYLVKGLSKLKLLKINYGKFEKATEIECMDAGPLQPLKMYVMDLSQNLHLYTGKQKIMSVCLPEPLQGVELGTLNLNQFVNGGFNISCCNNSERSARLQIPPLCQSDLVLSCIQSLKDILSSDEFNLVAARYYCQLHHENTTYQSEWEVFIQVSIKLLGFPESSIKNIKENVSSPAPPEPKKAKKSDSYTGYEDWQYLLSCKPNKFVDDDESKSMEKKYISDISLQKNALLFNHICAAFSLWHNLYEELKLNTLNTNLEEFAKFLHYLSEVFSLSSHVKIYETDFPCIKSKANTVYNLKEEFSSISEKCQQIKGFSLINHALDIFNNNNMDEPPPKHSHRMKYSTVLLKIFAAISKYTQSTSSSSDPEEMLEQLKLAGKELLVDTIINIMLKEGFTANDLDKLPIGYQIPIKEIFHNNTRSTNQIAMSLETAMFLGREDIVSLKQLELKENTKLSSKLKPSHDEDDKDGMLIDEQIFELRFKDDLRVHEVKRLLNSSDHVTVSVEQKPDMNDHAFAKEEESKLLILSKRTMSLSVARGMLTLGTAEPKSSKAVIIPTLDLSGRSSTSSKTIQIPQSDLNALLLWPNFHNGVAAGLKVARENCKVDSNWILLNKMKYSKLNASHSGFLFALGLMGHFVVTSQTSPP